MAGNPDDDPIRIVALPFAGDAWAATGTHLAPPLTEALLRVRVTTGEPLRWRVVGYDGTDNLASPVVGDASTASTTFVKTRDDRRGNETCARTVPTGLLATGNQVSEKDVSANEVGLIGFDPAFPPVKGTASALWVFLDAGGAKVGP